MRLAIGGPTRDTVPASFALDLAQLYAYTRERGPWQTVTIGFKAATYIHMGREYFLEDAIRQGATHVLWLDTDMSFPRETANWLALHDVPIVGCNYVTRHGSNSWTAMRSDGTRIETTSITSGLEEVGAMGFGVVLMRTDLVVGFSRPRFRHGLNAQEGDIGEDIMFCRSIRASGQPIYIDHDLSKEIGHIGHYNFGYRTLAAPAEVPV